MAVNPFDLLWDALPHVGMKDPFANQVLHRGALPEGTREADVRPFSRGERRVSSSERSRRICMSSRSSAKG
jgi:hypothetical protein